jgi:carboxyl-terminal processing protease
MKRRVNYEQGCTDVTIAIEREGVPELMDFTITLAKNVVHAVPYSGMLDKSIV